MSTAVIPADDDLHVGDDGTLVENTAWIDQRMKNMSTEESDQLKRAEEDTTRTNQTADAKSASTPAAAPATPVPSPPELLPPLKHECSNLLCKTIPLPAKLSLCGRCRQVQYCSKDCQAQDWKKTHKQDCLKLIEKTMLQNVDMTSPTSSSSSESTDLGKDHSSPSVLDDKAIRRKALVDKSRARVASKKKRDTDKHKVTASGQPAPDISGILASMTDVFKNMSNGDSNDESKRAAFKKQAESITSTIGKLMPGQQKNLSSIMQKMTGKTDVPAHEPTKGKGKKRNKTQPPEETPTTTTTAGEAVLELPPDD